MTPISEATIEAQPGVARYDIASPDYLERVYAGVLGKLVGVYLGRPVENWLYDKIVADFGEIRNYIHEQRGRRLIVTDDDISGTFTFLRALEDYDFDPNLTPAQIGQTWLNYLIEKTTILWWGGFGNSTEHTAYLRLKNGIQAPMSGSAAMNSYVVAEQIGGQIFIDGWGLVCPGDPVRAADFARRAASVSHDGEAIYGAQVVAALVAEAFVESDIDRLLDTALAQIPSNCTIRQLIDDLRGWHAAEADWRENRARLQAEYGYHRFPGHCHIVPNHGLIILSLLHGAGDFDESMMIVNTSGWDTDCNSGNVGAILGVRNGFAAFEKTDWRGPVADRLYLPSADPGRAITDAAREAIAVANTGRALQGQPAIVPKDGERFHFSLPGSVQGWQALNPEAGRVAWKEGEDGRGALELYQVGEEPLAASTPTFIPPHTKDMVTGYVLVACPTLYPSHEVRVVLRGRGNGRLFLSHYTAEDGSERVYGPSFALQGAATAVSWVVPDTGGYPIHEIGVELESGQVEIASIDWQGVPTTSWPPVDGTMWARAWGKGLDRFEFAKDRYEYLTQNEGVGMLLQGSREWRDYAVEARLTPRMAESAGIAVRVQGLRRHYGFVFGAQGEVRIDKRLDGHRVLAQAAFPWRPFQAYQVRVEAHGTIIRGYIDGQLVLEAEDLDRPLPEGGFGFLVQTGCLGAGTPQIQPL